MSVLSRRLFFLTNKSGLFSPLSVTNRFTSAGPPTASPSKPGSFSDKYDKFVSRWPKVYAVHRMVVDGSRWCFSDIKTYVNVRRALYSEKRAITDLSTPELEVLVQCPPEMLKILLLMASLDIPVVGEVLIVLLAVTPAEGPKLAVVLTLLPLPFTVYIIGFAIIFFPRLILTRHFWSDSQRKEFFLMDVKKSLDAAGGIPSALGQPGGSLSGAVPPKLEDFKNELMFACSRLHGLLPIPGAQSRLKKRIDALRILDKKISVELDNLTLRQLYFHLYLRRIDYAGKSEEECRKCLKEWTKFTSGMDDAKYALAPFFFNGRK